jgi:hypothetical protein
VRRLGLGNIEECSMPFILVQTYSILAVTLQGSPFETANNIVLKPLPNVGEGNGVAQAQITHTSFLAGGAQGFVSGSSPALRITVYAPLGQYEVYREILQTESPVYFTWNVPQGTQISSFYMSTGDEWPGEGPLDTSP